MKLVEIGRVSRPHGVRGELKVQLHYSASETLEHIDVVTLRKQGAADLRATVLGVRPTPNAVLLSLENVGDRDAAEALRGYAVCVERSMLPELEPGEYYLCDLIGARVVAPTGDVGEVIDIRVHRTVDSLVIRTPEGALVEQPLLEPWITDVDVKGLLVRLASTEGLL